MSLFQSQNFCNKAQWTNFIMEQLELVSKITQYFLQRYVLLYSTLCNNDKDI